MLQVTVPLCCLLSLSEDDTHIYNYIYRIYNIYPAFKMFTLLSNSTCVHEKGFE